MKKVYAIYAIVLVTLAGMTAASYWYAENYDPEAAQEKALADKIDEGPHYHAGFGIVIDGELQDLSGVEHMFVKPCGRIDEDGAIEAMERAHLHDGVGDIIHIHDEGVTWNVVLENLGYGEYAPDIIAYNNQGVIDNVLEQVVQPYEVITFSNNQLLDPEQYLANLPDRAAIELNEEQSNELCSL